MRYLKVIAINLFRASVVIAIIHPNSSPAFEEPAVNLGASSFFDGMAAVRNSNAEAGFYVNEYLQWYSANRFNNNQGNAIPGAPNLQVYTSLTQLIYLMDKPHFFGARLGFDALIPVVSMNASTKNPPFNANPGSLGDLTLGPALQFDPIMHGTNVLFMNRLDFDVIVPTGSYAPRFALNPGANVLSVNPYWAGTLFLGSDVVTSWRIHYLWSDANNRPDLAFYPPGARVQAGQAIHLNFDAAYNVYDHRLYAGFNGYYFKQFTEDQINGISAPSTEERVLGAGPGAVFRITDDSALFLNWYFETAVANRSCGTRLNVVFACHF